MIQEVASKLLAIVDNKEYQNPAGLKQLLNCIRILTRVLPFIYENGSENEDWTEQLFWAKTSDDKMEPALGEKLAKTAMDLLFCQGFTVPKVVAPTGNSDKTPLTIWETGIGCTVAVTSTHEMESNKVETLRFLLTLCSDCLYTSPTVLPLQGSKFLTYMVTMIDKRVVMATLCSLLNTCLKYSPGWKVPYDHMFISDRHRQIITYSLQFLLVLLIYPIPESVSFEINTEKGVIKNQFRHFCGKIHKTEDLQFIAQSLSKMLSQPIHASFTILPGSIQEITWVPELIMLFWDLIHCNKKFRAYLIASDRVHDYMMFLLYYIQDKRFDSTKVPLVRLCSYVLLYLTTEKSFAISLSKPFSGQNLPHNIQSLSISGSYADYLILQLCKLINTGGDNLNFLVPTFLDCIHNVSPFLINISYQAASNLIQLCGTLSNPSFLFATKTNHHLLSTILKCITLLLECHFQENSSLVFLLVKNQRIFNSINSLVKDDNIKQVITSSIKNPDFKLSTDNEYPARINNEDSFVIDSDNESNSEEDTIEAQEARKHPELASLATRVKDKGKGVTRNSSILPSPLVSPTNQKTEGLSGGEFQPSVPWTSTWLPLLPLHTILATIQHITSNVAYFHTAEQSPLVSTDINPSQVIDSLRSQAPIPGVDMFNIHPIIPENPTPLTTFDLPADFQVSRFPWNTSSLGWYESILWGCIFQSESQVVIAESTTSTNSTSSPVGVWNGTNIKLFKLQERGHRGPTLMSPKGAVDAMADAVMMKIGQLRTGK